MKRVCNSSPDRITDLPAHVIQCILVFLPIKDATKTSVLSRKWRHQWRSIPQLVFDDGFVEIREETESERSLMNKQQVLLNIYKSLLLRDGPITKFVLSIPRLNPCHEIDLIVLYLSSKGVRHLTLVFSRNSDEYQMHSSLFSALHLKSLKLRSCEVTPPSWFVGFSKLTHLDLNRVTLPCDFFKDFLPKCPLLESLSVVDCDGLEGNLDIVAPFLKSFTLVVDFLDICFSFKSTPLLSYVVLDWNDDCTDGGVPDMVSLFASLPALQQFHVNYEILKNFAGGGRNVPARLPTLHLLEVFDMKHVIFDVSGMERVFVCLIMSSPNLCSLTIQVSTLQQHDQLAGNEVSSLWRSLEAEDCPGSSHCLQQLRECRIVDNCATLAELDLMRFILATAPLLRSIHITPYHKLGTKKIMKCMKEVMQYTRISKEAKVVYDWNDEED
ncbi:unnamed protein product [Linum tenue]|uniref:F-box domain-containing protein n=1 Tax=Linum tenue TaxID=586396 RepID=A0AAV0NKW4_9ROSI|nr:unnamed protein product [Linum tenue]